MDKKNLQVLRLLVELLESYVEKSKSLELDLIQVVDAVSRFADKNQELLEKAGDDWKFLKRLLDTKRNG